MSNCRLSSLLPRWHPDPDPAVHGLLWRAAATDLSDDWADFDDAGDQSVGVYNVEWVIERSEVEVGSGGSTKKKKKKKK
jgi:hypothetical protein